MATNIDSLQRVQNLSYVQLVIQATYLNLMIVLAQLDLLVLESDNHLKRVLQFPLTADYQTVAKITT